MPSSAVINPLTPELDTYVFRTADGASDISSSIIVFAIFGLTFATRDDMSGHSFACLAMFKKRKVRKNFYMSKLKGNIFQR